MSIAPIRLAVLGSTNGTDLQAIIEAIESQSLHAKIEVVLSNRKKAYILQRARKNNLRAIYVSQKGKERFEYDLEVLNILSQFKLDLIVLIGYMRILSPFFVNSWKNKIINVHPSLLPEFAGGMDTDVHEQVILAKKKETGCTVHLVEEKVDQGQILLQKKCPVSLNDTSESLKKKVQKLEGEALIQVIEDLRRNIKQLK
jgi:phosphoribosylglycinamide formyltransferase 1